MLTLQLLLPDCLPSHFHLQWCLDNSDPDPELKMVAMRIFPWMLIVIIHGLDLYCSTSWGVCHPLYLCIFLTDWLPDIC